MAVRNLLTLYDAIVKTIPRLPEIFAEFQTTLAEIQAISEMQGVNRTGVTLDKNRLKKSLADLIMKYSNMISIFARQAGNETLHKEVRFAESGLRKEADVLIRDKAQIVYDRVQANIDLLAGHGMNADTQKQFLEKIETFNKLIASPRISITERRKATLKIPVLFDKADSEMELMDLAVKSVKTDNPDFFNAYKTARTIVDTGAGTLGLRATARIAPGGEPLSGAVFVFRKDSNTEGQDEIIKLTSAKGSFNLKSIKPGTWQLTVSKQGYQDKQTQIEVTEGERCDVLVEMEKQ
jgi:hypothetical protein